MINIMIWFNDTMIYIYDNEEDYHEDNNGDGHDYT